MQKVHLNEDHRELFASAGLKSFDEFFDYKDGDIVNKNKKRNVLSFTIDHDGTKKQFFMKRFQSPHFKDMFSTFVNFGYICSQARCEWNNASTLLKNGIDTYHPVCYGEDVVCGIEKRSFFITEAIDGVCLTDFVADKWDQMSRQEKEEIVTSIAALTRTAHDARISLPDLYLWHFFMKEKSPRHDHSQFAVIDLHRMSTKASLDTRYRNLAAFIFSLSEKYFDESFKKLFLDAYMGDDFPYDPDQLLAKVNKRIATVTARRRRMKY